MRKALAWLGVATLVLLSSSLARAAGDTVLKPYVVLILDTSGSMVRTDGFGNPTGYGPPTCGGIDNKLDHAKCAIYNIANSYGDIVFALGRFRNNMSGTTTAATFPQGCCSHGPDASGGGCPAGPTCTASDNMFELLTGLVDGGNQDAATWVNFTGDTCDASGTDPEIWNADSNTPLGGALAGAKDYFLGQQASDGTTIWPSGTSGFDPIANDPYRNSFLNPPGTSTCDPDPNTCDASAGCTGTSCCCVSQCRPYIVILLTDGDETCGGDPPGAATSLLTTDLTIAGKLQRYRVITKPIGFGVPVGYQSIEDIAHAGGNPDIPGQDEGYYAQDQAGLELAISQIIEGSIRSESCNELDDDCDGQTDEDFPGKGNPCTNGLPGACAVAGNLVCSADGTGLVCDAGVTACNGKTDGTACTVTDTLNQPMPGTCTGGACVPDMPPPGAEQCNNGVDDDCDGKVDEGCTTCVPTGEICDNKDNDCDGNVDEGLTQQCGTGACLGTETCVNGVYTGCTAQTPTTETCNGLDDDCDGVADGITEACSNIVTPGGPSTDNPGDPNHVPPPIPENVCHPGQKTCAVAPPGNGTFSACTQEEEGCNPGQDPNVHCDGCDGLDNDCDNKIDEDFVPADCSTNCGVGQTTCVNGVIMCNSTPATDDPTCDGVDDDCDGMIDEDWQCDPSPGCTGPDCCDCGGGTVCMGMAKCIAGSVQCVGGPINPESCNCDDDDCDGTVDEDATCPAGSTCTDCQCAFPCSPGEFPCPLGKKCSAQNYCVDDPCYGVDCPPVNGNVQTCVEDANHQAQCVDTCTTVTCAQGLICYGPTGTCQPDDCRTFGCPNPDENCVVDGSGNASCVANPCAGVTCPTDQYCVSGQCYSSCAGVTCPSDQRCRLGTCQPDPCGHACPYGQACDDSSGQCVDDPCKYRQCPEGQWCDPNNGGQCEPDPCVGTTCPEPGQVCKGGTCYDPEVFQPDAGTEAHVTVGGGGCSTTGGGAGSGLLLGLCAVLLYRRRRPEGERTGGGRS